ncbi:MAG: class I SAM-dependent methyltransferase [Gemmatimonadaceae bacterium]
MFERVARLTRYHRLALDCGTGSGQAALGLIEHYERVIAIDPSSEQLSRARTHGRIEYLLAKAEDTALPDHSVDLVVSAQGLHWFDTRKFFLEAKRVLSSGGAIAIWGYGDPVLESDALNAILHEFNRGLLEKYWFPERQLLLDGYRTVEFPFREVEMPRLVLEKRWTLEELAGYIRSWSAVGRYSEAMRTDAVADLQNDLAAVWGEPQMPRLVQWPLHIRAGYP